MAKLATGIDVGTTAVRILQGYDKKGVFTLSAFVSGAVSPPPRRWSRRWTARA